jgi:hypothetical protein
MKITIEFDPGELVKGAAQIATAAEGQAGAAEPMASRDMAVATATAVIGGIDAGPGPGAAVSEIPAELATQAAAIGAISAGPAPNPD